MWAQSWRIKWVEISLSFIVKIFISESWLIGLVMSVSSSLIEQAIADFARDVDILVAISFPVDPFKNDFFIPSGSVILISLSTTTLPFTYLCKLRIFQIFYLYV